jgi:hypothetical protein
MSDNEELDDLGEYITSILGDTGVTQITKRKRKTTKTEGEKKAKRKIYNQTMRDKLKSNNSLCKANLLEAIDTLTEWVQDENRQQLTHDDLIRIFDMMRKDIMDMRFPY